MNKEDIIDMVEKVIEKGTIKKHSGLKSIQAVIQNSKEVRQLEMFLGALRNLPKLHQYKGVESFYKEMKKLMRADNHTQGLLEDYKTWAYIFGTAARLVAAKEKNSFNNPPRSERAHRPPKKLTSQPAIEGQLAKKLKSIKEDLNKKNKT